MVKRRGAVVIVAAMLSWPAAPALAQSCTGDCNRDGRVKISEIVAGISVALDTQAIAVCVAMDSDVDAQVSIDELLRATNDALNGCAFFAPVSELPGWPQGANVNAVSPDGRVLLADDIEKGWRWADGEATNLGVLPVSKWTYPVAASSDGTIVVGATNGGSAEGFRWTDDQIAQFGDRIYPNDVSADGITIAGYRHDGNDSNVAFRWRDGTLTDLGYLRPSSYTEADALSADGTTVVGFGQYEIAPDVRINEAFRWRDGILQGLGFLAPGAGANSVAVAVSADGAVVAGTSQNGAGLEAFRWEDGVMTGLGVLPDYQESVATAISGDGDVVFGRCQRTVDWIEHFTAFVWDASHGMRELAPVLSADFGLDLRATPLLQVIDVSLDGRTIVGGGLDNRAPSWLARLGHGW